MNKIKGGVTAAKGYKASGIHAGIKKKRKDMSLVFSEVPAKVAGTFTTNVVKAAPVKWDMKIVKEQENVQAVILNSGVANACTGELGDKNNYIMAKSVANTLNISSESVLTASTGVIGKQLPIDKIQAGIKVLVNELDCSLEAGTHASEGIMTTDTYSKESARSFKIDNKEVKIGGMAKGSGMIHPNMATMLSVVTTDIKISKNLLQKAIRENVKDTFNMVSVDRDTSTNDTYLILANGLAENDEIKEENEAYYKFCEALKIVTTDLAKQMAADGEGATRLFETVIIGGKSKEDAVILSKSVITSNLVKTAIYGRDANWGRILCALGYSGVDFDPDKIDLFIESEDGKLLLVENGVATDYSEEIATKILSSKEVRITADMKMGVASATAWGCDLTYDYIKINADYRS